MPYEKETIARNFNRLKANLKLNKFIIDIDYSKNYKYKEQDEIQKAYIGHNSFFNIYDVLLPMRE